MPNYAVIDKSGNPVSFGTEVADAATLKEQGLEAVEIDRIPGPEEEFDRTTRKVRALTEDELDARNPGRREARERQARINEKRDAARKTGATTAQKLDYIIELLEGRV